jgi:hypothetical protein
MPAGRYKIRSVITDKDLGIFEKSDWVRGISISFANAQSVEVLEVTALKE